MDKVTISEIAKQAGVSPTTVSRVMNNSTLVKKATADQVRAVMLEMGYQPNELARSLRSNATKTIGVVVSNVLNPFFTSVVRGIEDVANQSNYNIVLCNSDEDPEKEIRYIRTLIAKQVDGLVVASSEQISNYSEIIGAKPVVFVDRRPEGRQRDMYDTVLVQNRSGSCLAVTHLIEQGYRRIGIITGQSRSTTGHERLLGYRDAHKKAGLPVDPGLIRLGDFRGHSGYQLALELIHTGCDAVFAANNMILLGALRAICETGTSMPDQIGLVAFDDMEWMQYFTPSISAVAQPTYEIGQAALSMLLDRIAGRSDSPRQIVLDVALISRQSSLRRATVTDCSVD